MHTINHEYLATHPVDEPASFTLSLPTPERFNAPPASDGSPSQIALTVTGPTYQDTLQALSQFQDQDQLAIMIHSLISAHTGNDQLKGDELRECFEKIENPAPVHTFSLNLTDENDNEAEVEFELTTPSFQAATGALKHISKPHNLLSLAINLHPENDTDSFGDDD